MILRCNSDKCRAGHSQDKIHGPGLRVMNVTKDPEQFRCTVCSGVVKVEKKGGAVAPSKMVA